jgi:hypothetical protein
MVSVLGGKVPYDWGFAEHDYADVNNRGFAFSEGFADFNSLAMWADAIGINAPSFTPVRENFYANRVPNPNPPPNYLDLPFYRGSFSNTNGDSVEGALMQFFWDLYDNQQTNDHEPNIDDDGIDGGISRIVNTLASLGTQMTVETSIWDTIGTEEGETLAFKYRKAHFQGPSYDFSNRFKAIWNTNYSWLRIDELYNVDVHPFDYLEPYPVPPPTGLYASDTTHNSVTLRWTDDAQNEGQYLIYRQRAGLGWVIIGTLSQNSTRFINRNLDYCTGYYYKVRALTCDTSAPSNLIYIRTKYLPVTYLQANAGNKEIQLRWNNPGGNFAGTLIVRSANRAIDWDPTDGTSYALNQWVSPSVKVVHNDDDNHSQNPFIDTGLTNGTTYYYKAFAYNSSTWYSKGI